MDVLKDLKEKVIVGVDEVGRGCWAGPLVVGAVIIDEYIDGLTDSKLLHKSKRVEVAKLIRSHAAACSTGWVSPEEIDSLGLTKATTLAIERAIEDIKEYDLIIIDGSINFMDGNPKSKNLIRADSSVPAVSAASIIAKVARDEYMAEQSLIYPEYGFANHVGYGTAAHKKALVEYGITPMHRKSYRPVKALIGTE